ncbi:MAG TPA: two-component regulator propeller domain-containing protein [Thermoanaerobaculia bacterium]
MRSRFFCALLMLAAAAGAGRAYGLDPDRAATQYGIETWQRKQGLPQGTVTALAQTPDGYLWLGTQEGLVRFDGVRFTVFDRKSSPALRRHHVTTLAVAPDGALWIGLLGGGLVSHRAGEFRAWGPAQGLPDEIVSSIVPESDGTVWVGTFAHGVVRLTGERFGESLTAATGLASDEVRVLRRGKDGALWVGTRGGGLQRWKDGRAQTWTSRDGLPSDQVTSLIEDAAGAMWIGTRGGLARLSEGRLQSWGPKDGLPSDTVLCLVIDRDGELWAGTVGGGVVRVREGRFEPLSKTRGLNGDSVLSMLEDREGNLWLGTDAGLDRLRGGLFTTFSASEGLPNSDVRPILQDSAGDLWVGTLGGGLARLREGRVVETVTTREGLLSDRVWALHQDAAGDLWVGTREGLNRRHAGRWESYTTKDGLAHNLVLSIASDETGALWIGTAGGLTRLEDGVFESFGRADGLSNERVMSIVPAKDGTLWLGTVGGGLNRRRGATLSPFGPTALTQAFVYDVLPDADGTLWVATATDGLWRFRAGQWRSFGTEQGLPDDVFYRILDDGAGSLWLSSNRGVARVSRADLERVASGGAREVAAISFDDADGMKDSECNGGFQPAGWKMRDGRLIFPTVEGIVSVDPSAAASPRAAVAPLLEQVFADGVEVPRVGVATLPPATGRLELRWTALAFRSPERLRFRYRLEGFDADWIEVGTRRGVSYTNLPAGPYRFRVAAAEPGGEWTEAAAPFAFRMQPRFTQTFWFWALLGAAAALLVLLLHRLRVRSIRLRSELDAARLQALRAQLQPHFLFNALNTILPLIYRDPKAASRTLVQLGDLLRATLDRDAAATVRLRDELEFLRRYLEIQSLRFEDRLQTTYAIAPETLDAEVPSLLLQPLVENAVKHGISQDPGRGEVRVSSRVAEGDLVLVVWNTSTRGPEPLPTHVGGIGLANLRDRLEVLYGRRARLTRRREPGSFEVEVRIPLKVLPGTAVGLRGRAGVPPRVESPPSHESDLRSAR